MTASDGVDVTASVSLSCGESACSSLLPQVALLTVIIAARAPQMSVASSLRCLRLPVSRYGVSPRLLGLFRCIRRRRWPAAPPNFAVILATAVQGAHHLMDFLAALSVTAIALFIALFTARSRNEIKIPSSLVKKTPSFRLAKVPPMVFRAAMEQRGAAQAVCD
jgi:hypothetical protein